MTETILIVEDDAMIAMLMEDILDALGKKPLGPASSVEQALSILANQQPNAAILDLKLGNQKSYPVMDRLRDLDIPFAIASGYGADIDRSHCGDDVITIPKPFVMKDVEAALNKLLV